MILNRVTAIDISDTTQWQPFHPLESNNMPPNAPVSYPFLWGTSRQDYVQWNASALNTFVYARDIRNLVEALGVFGRVNIQKSIIGSLKYEATVNLTNQRYIEENLISALRSPQWPTDIFGPTDAESAKAGSVLYQKYCSGCHEVTDRNSLSSVKTCVSRVTEIKTDPTMAMNAACRRVETGVLEGYPQIIIGRKWAHEEFALPVCLRVRFFCGPGAGLKRKSISRKFRSSVALFSGARAQADPQTTPTPSLRWLHGRTGGLSSSAIGRNLGNRTISPQWIRPLSLPTSSSCERSRQAVLRWKPRI